MTAATTNLDPIADIVAECKRLENEPLPGMEVAGKPVTRAMLSPLFDLVADPTNWKNPIRATVRLNSHQLMLMKVAVCFYAGCEARVEALTTHVEFDAEGRPVMDYVVTAKGYYAAGC